MRQRSLMGWVVEVALPPARGNDVVRHHLVRDAGGKGRVGLAALYRTRGASARSTGRCAPGNRTAPGRPQGRNQQQNQAQQLTRHGNALSALP